MAGSTDSSRLVVGNADGNFWLYTDRDGFDLTHPAMPSSPPVVPRVTLETTNTNITIAPAKTALVIIDMQNFFLSSALGRPRGEGHEAEETLLQVGIPAAREAGIQVIWCNWGISEAQLKTMPPNMFRTFGFEFTEGGDSAKRVARKRDAGLGSPLGKVKLEDGTEVDAGRMLMPDQWNSDLHAPLKESYLAGLKASVPDVWFHKQRLSGLWGPSCEMEDFLREKGITTLLFTGVNTDQCVLSTLQDAATKGFDTVLLEDGCGTRSPEYARQMVHYNCQKAWGFISTCASLAHGVRNITQERS